MLPTTSGLQSDQESNKGFVLSCDCDLIHFSGSGPGDNDLRAPSGFKATGFNVVHLVILGYCGCELQNENIGHCQDFREGEV